MIRNPQNSISNYLGPYSRASAEVKDPCMRPINLPSEMTVKLRVLSRYNPEWVASTVVYM